MSHPERATGTRDEHYNLVSVLYHALQAGETSDQYIRDADRAGDQDLVDFFRQTQKSDQERADRAKRMLKSRL